MSENKGYVLDNAWFASAQASADRLASHDLAIGYDEYLAIAESMGRRGDPKAEAIALYLRAYVDPATEFTITAVDEEAPDV